MAYHDRSCIIMIHQRGEGGETGEGEELWRTHRVAMVTFWRTLHHDGKMSPAYLPSQAKLWCALQLRQRQTTFHHCWRVKSSMFWMESTSPYNSLIGYSLKWGCCSSDKSLLSKIGFERLVRDNRLLDYQLWLYLCRFKWERKEDVKERKVRGKRKGGRG